MGKGGRRAQRWSGFALVLRALTQRGSERGGEEAPSIGTGVAWSAGPHRVFSSAYALGLLGWAASGQDMRT